MKRQITTFILTVLLCFPLCACEVKESTTITVTAADGSALYEMGLEQAALLEEMVNSQDYMALMTGSTSLQAALEPVQGKSLTAPASVYAVSFDAEALLELAAEGQVDLSAFSDPLREFVLHRLQNSILSILNSRAGAETLAAASICTVSHTYVGRSIERDALYLYFFPDAFPVMVSFHDGGGIVQANSTFLFGNVLTEDTLEAVTSLFESMGLTDIQVERVEGKNP